MLVQAKFDWWQQLSQQVTDLAKQGYAAADIRDELLGKENLFAQVTEGDMSKLNLIHSFFSHPQIIIHLNSP